MTRIAYALISAFLGLSLTVGSARAQTKPLKDQIVGTWMLVSAKSYGDNPLGTWMFDPNGHFAAILMRKDVATYASGNRLQTTPVEQKATVDGTIAFFGTYTADGTDLKFHVDGSTFPNWKGTDQKRSNVTVNGDEFRYTQPTPSSGGAEPEQNVWRRAK
jgi:hypothetical protein